MLIIIFLSYWVVAFLIVGVILSQLNGMNKELRGEGKTPIEMETVIVAMVIWPITLLVVVGNWIGGKVWGKD